MFVLLVTSITVGSPPSSSITGRPLIHVGVGWGGGGERHFKGALRHSLFHHDVAEEEEEESQVSDSPACDSDGEAIAQY